MDQYKIASSEKLQVSLMPSPASLDISTENVSNMVAFLKNLQEIAH
tara:strand:- start:2216 stop:2353 length:138 start_codon:yes stop_codon:yes gene_type:complete